MSHPFPAQADGGPYAAVATADAFDAAGARAAAAFGASGPATFAPLACALRRFTVAGARRCLKKRRVVFLGDSVLAPGRDTGDSTSLQLEAIPDTKAWHALRSPRPRPKMSQIDGKTTEIEEVL